MQVLRKVFDIQNSKYSIIETEPEEPVIFFKFFPENLILNGFQYKLGINKDIHPFDSSKKCSKGGLYYTDIQNIMKYEHHINIKNIMESAHENQILNTNIQNIKKSGHHDIVKYEHGGPVIGVIKIPKKVPIVKIGDKYKSPEINIIELHDYKKFLSREDLYLEEKKKITDINFVFKKMPYLQTFEMYMEAVKRYGLNLQYVRKDLQTTKMCMIAVKQYGSILQDVKPELQTPEMCMIAVKRHGSNLQFVIPELRSDIICMEAVKQNNSNLRFVLEFQSIEMCMEAVKYYSPNLEFVKPEFQTLEMCMIAVKFHVSNLQFVKPELKKIVSEMLGHN